MFHASTIYIYIYKITLYSLYHLNSIGKECSMIFDGIAAVRVGKNGGKEPKRESWASHARTTHHNFLYLNGRADIIANGRRKQRLRNVMQSLTVRAEEIEGERKDVRNLVRSNEDVHNLSPVPPF